MKTMIPKWLELAREIQAMAQTGLTYTHNEYDLQRYQRLTEIAAEIVAAQAELSKGSVLENFQVQAGYATPKVDVRAAVIRDGRILLVREKIDGKWSMPGGWADVGELPSAMVAREAWEESGFTVKADKLIGVFDANHIEPLQFYHAYKMIFLCTITVGEARPSDETLAVDFFDPNDLPPLSELRTNKRILDEVFAHYSDPHRPPFFD
jgi:ADP-ribose pyrophosphatase YjhB (NUDIX family)